MEFWLIMIGFIVMGGSCSLAGTWWDRKNKKDKKEEKIKEKMKEIEEKWYKNINLLSCYLEHNELEKVQRQITLIKGNIDVKEYNQATPQLEECKFIINHIIDKESFLIRNIF